MSKTNDGGPAFPHLGTYKGADGNYHPTPTQYEGMSLRAWLVGQAIAGLDLEEWIDKVLQDGTMNSKKAYGVIATHAIGVADAAIAALNQEPQQ